MVNGVFLVSAVCLSKIRESRSSGFSSFFLVNTLYLPPLATVVGELWLCSLGSSPNCSTTSFGLIDFCSTELSLKERNSFVIHLFL